ncbi:MAG TPA: hypothetical protein VFM18_07990, partial [Methanosarcina sp.]|nr:hypothetical protein [Methanosarcina sp.]
MSDMKDPKQEIYKYLDEHGFSFNYSMPLSISFDFETSQPKFGTESELHITSPKFGMSSQEFEEVILDYILDTTNVRIPTLKDIRKYSTLNNLPFIIQVYGENGSNMRYTLAFGKIDGNVDITSEDKLESLGNIKEISQNLTLKGSSIKSLGELTMVGGSLYVRQLDPPFTKLNSLGNLEFVGENLILKNTPLHDLGKLKHVGAKLNLRNTRIESLGNLEYVGGDLFLPKHLDGKINTGNITIGGNVKYFRT